MFVESHGNNVSAVLWHSSSFGSSLPLDGVSLFKEGGCGLPCTDEKRAQYGYSLGTQEHLKWQRCNVSREKGKILFADLAQHSTSRVFVSKVELLGSSVFSQCPKK